MRLLIYLLGKGITFKQMHHQLGLGLTAMLALVIDI